MEAQCSAELRTFIIKTNYYDHPGIGVIKIIISVQLIFSFDLPSDSKNGSA